MYPLLTNINSQFIDDCGKPLAGGKVYTYEANTTTPKATYADVEGLAANTNPIILDESGRANIHLDGGAYRIRVLNKKGALIADTPEISRYVTGTELDGFLQDIEGGINELNQVKETLETVTETVISNQKGAAGGLAPLDDETALVDPIYLPKATETAIGVVELATVDEIKAGTDAAKVITPKAFKDAHFGAIDSLNGWYRLPDGKIEQFGYVARGATSANISIDITFPTPFPNACLNIQTTIRDTAIGSGSDAQFHVLTPTTLKFSGHFQLYNQDAGLASIDGFYWRAIGN